MNHSIQEQLEKPCNCYEESKGLELIGGAIGTGLGFYLVYKYTEQKWWQYFLGTIILSTIGSKIGKGLNDIF